jgi:hypothetical protein
MIDKRRALEYHKRFGNLQLARRGCFALIEAETSPLDCFRRYRQISLHGSAGASLSHLDKVN